MPKVEEGDILAIEVAGAYGFVMASSYNGVLKPAEVLVNNNHHQLIRQREEIWKL